MPAAPPISSRSSQIASRALSGVAATLAILSLIWAVGLAARTLAPWGDSPRAVYALVADVLLGVGTLLLACAITARSALIFGRRFPRWLEPLVYLMACLTVALPLTISATNSFEASSMGQGDPSLLLIALGGLGLSGALVLLMRRGVLLGLITSLVLAGALVGVALITAR